MIENKIQTKKFKNTNFAKAPRRQPGEVWPPGETNTDTHEMKFCRRNEFFFRRTFQGIRTKRRAGICFFFKMSSHACLCLSPQGATAPLAAFLGPQQRSRPLRYRGGKRAARYATADGQSEKLLVLPPHWQSL